MTINNINNRIKFAVVLTLFLFGFQLINAQTFLINEKNLVGEKTAKKVNEIGQELKEKTTVNVYAIIDTDIGNLSVEEYLAPYSNSFDSPYVFLFIATDDKIIDIISSKEELYKTFNKDKILSPFPLFGGTILPLLVDKKKDSDKYSAAVLNGYADLTEQIAKSYNIELENGIGNANRSTLNIVRILIYGFIVVVLVVYFIKKVKFKNAKKE